MDVLDFYHLYRNLSVTLINGIRLNGIDVHEYGNAKDYFAQVPSDNISADHDVTDGMSAWNKLNARIKKKGEKIGTYTYRLTYEIGSLQSAGQSYTRTVSDIVTTTDLAPVFYGKGSPGAIQLALRTAVALGLVQPNVDALNAYCTANIGLDCSGFVGNYLRHEGLAGGSIGPSNKVSSFSTAGNRIASLADIRGGTVMVQKSGRHVAIIDRVEFVKNMQGWIYAKVAESTGSELIDGDAHTDGLNYTTYIFKSVDAKSKVFKTSRTAFGGTSNVYLANHN